MLEIPESNTISRQLRETIIGKKIIKVVAAYTTHGFTWYSGDPSSYHNVLVNKTIDDAKAVAGQVEIYAANMRILFCDGVNIRYFTKEMETPKKHQLYIEFDDNSKIVCTVQMLGGIYLNFENNNKSFYYLVAKEKPSPLSDEFDEDYFNKLFNDTEKKLSVKALLATEQRIPGLGNGTLHDILFNAMINPQTKLSTLKDKDIDLLYKSVKSTLSDMTNKGGRDTEKDLFGNIGGYMTTLSSKTADKGCPRCGDNIVKKAYLGGSVYFCPTCQPIFK